MKIALIAGIPNWAGHKRCKNLKTEFEKLGHKVRIITGESHEINKKFYRASGVYDIVHFQFTGCVSAMLKTIKRAKKRKAKIGATIVSERTLCGYNDHDRPGDLFEFLYDCDFVTASNPRIANMLNCPYIPHGVDAELFKPKEAFRVGNVGAKDDFKGFELIKQACEELGCELVTDESSYPDNVMTHKKMVKLYQSMDCYVCASKSEGCNNPVLEAMACNVPVISTDVGIAKELGVTIVPRTVGGIKDAINKLMGRHKILENYTVENIAKQYNELYEA